MWWQALYDRAVSECLAHEKLVDALGEPIKAFGEESRRGRCWVLGKVCSGQG